MKLLHRWRLSRALDEGWPVPARTMSRVEGNEGLGRYRASLEDVDRRLRADLDLLPPKPAGLHGGVLRRLRQAGAGDGAKDLQLPPSISGPGRLVTVAAAVALLVVSIAFFQSRGQDPKSSVPGELTGVLVAPAVNLLSDEADASLHRTLESPLLTEWNNVMSDSSQVGAAFVRRLPSPLRRGLE